MPTIAPKPVRTLAPEGTHIARCVGFIHIGTVQETYMGELKDSNKIRLTFELPEETKVWKEGEDPKPVVISQEYTLSMGEKANLRKLVNGMCGSMSEEEAGCFDVESLVGKACLLTIVHKTSKAGNERAEIATASPLMKGQVCPPQVNPSKILSYSNWDEELYNSQPDFLKDKIKTSKEYLAMSGEVADPDAIPF